MVWGAWARDTPGVSPWTMVTFIGVVVIHAEDARHNGVTAGRYGLRNVTFFRRLTEKSAGGSYQVMSIMDTVSPEPMPNRARRLPSVMVGGECSQPLAANDMAMGTAAGPVLPSS